MKTKKLMAILLVVLMFASVLTACGNSEEPVDVGSNSGSSGQVASTPDDGDGADEDEDGELAVVEVWNANFGADVSTVDAVAEAINEITEKEIGVHVNFTWIPASDYDTQLNLAIANHETVDLASMPFVGFSYAVGSGMAMDITDYYNADCPDIANLIGDMINVTSIDGKIYGIPTYTDTARSEYIIIRKDILDQLGLTEAAEGITTWAEFEDLMQQIKDSDFSGYAIGGGSGDGMLNDEYFLCGEKLTDTYTWDKMGDDTLSICTDQDGNVFCTFSDERFVEQAKLFADWLDKGYLYPDTAFDTTQKTSLLQAGTFASMLYTTTYDAAMNAKAEVGYDCVVLKLATGLTGNTYVSRFCKMIPSTSAEPEAALKLLNLFYTNSDLMNLFVWGIEGENYEVNDAGEACYIDGADSSNCGYHAMNWTMGNSFLVLPDEGSGSNYRDEQLQSFTDAPKSIYFGVPIDLSDADTLISNVNAVTSQYWDSFVGGQYSDELYAECMEKLQAAGIDEYVALYQQAADDYLD